VTEQYRVVEVTLFNGIKEFYVEQYEYSHLSFFGRKLYRWKRSYVLYLTEQEAVNAITSWLGRKVKQERVVWP
jgi:hypothetical protein